MELAESVRIKHDLYDYGSELLLCMFDYSAKPIVVDWLMSGVD